MRTVTIAWHPAEERFAVSGTHPGQVVITNAPHASPDRGATGFSPTELLLAGAGACAAWDVVEILRKARQPLDALDVTVTGRQASQPPFAYETITLHFTLRGDLRAAAVERAVRLSCERYCSVLATMRGVARVSSTFEIAPRDPEARVTAAPTANLST